MIEFHPGFVLLIGALLAAVLPARARQAVMILAPCLALFFVFILPDGMVVSHTFVKGLDLIVLKVDTLSRLFGMFFCVITLIGNIYAIRVKKRGESVGSLVYAGSCLGVVFAGDWLTLFLFWELMAVSSAFFILYSKTPQAIRAGLRYILVHFFSGNLLLFGIVFKAIAGQTELSILSETGGAAYWLILLGVSINAAVIPFNAWLTDAYPEGTIGGTVFLGAFTTKVAIYCLMRIFPGTELLIWIGVMMAIYGVVYALLENDIRRLLSYHIVCQIGFIVAAVGIGTELALNGAALHAYGNILFKSLLLMCVGAVIYTTGRRKLTDLGGIYKEMPVVVILYMVGAFAIAGVPLFNGFVSKAMIVSAAAESAPPAVGLLLNLVGLGTFLSICLKLPYFMFFGPDKGIRLRKKVPANMISAMAASAFLCVLYGVVPALLDQHLLFDVRYQPYTWSHVISTIQFQIAALAVFCIFLPKLAGKPTISLDTDWFYRKPLNAFIFFIVHVTISLQAKAGVLGASMLRLMAPILQEQAYLRHLGKIRHGLFSPIFCKDHYWFPIGTVIFMLLLMFVGVFANIFFHN